MHYGIEVVNVGERADPRRVIELAVAAEQAGWEGIFLWDHLGIDRNFAAGDPWVALAAVATVTTRLRLGTAVTPLPATARRCSRACSRRSTCSAAGA